MSTATVDAPPARVRLPGLDRARGLAIVLMIGDHVCLLAGVEGYRVTLGRLAMPLFFVLAGHLAGRLRARHAQIAVLGLGLPLVVPFIDSPNVLLWWALGCVALAAARRAGVGAWWLIVPALTLAANGWHLGVGSSYGPAALLALMGLGALLPAGAWSWSARLPSMLEPLGRHPVAWYVGHLLALRVVQLVAGL